LSTGSPERSRDTLGRVATARWLAFVLPLVACGADPPRIGAEPVGAPLVVLPPASASDASASVVPEPVAASAPADARPPDIHLIDINFENKVHLIGYRFDPETSAPGKSVKITFFWRCDAAIDEGWQLFTHISDDATLKSVAIERQGPERWKPGKSYVDEQTYTVPMDVRGATLTVYAGIWKQDARLRIIVGPNDGDNRALVGKIPTGLSPPP
jgi:hypothetical protein